MYLEKLSLLNFKNIAEANLTFSSKINCFLGNNGMGKTNILDALYYLSFTKSFMQPVDSLNICHHEEFFLIQGAYIKHNAIEEIYCGLKRHRKKQFKRNKKEYDRLSDHIGFVPLVLIAPSDSELIGGGSEERRKFVDMVLSQYNKEYLHTLIRYNKALQQRNSMLKLDNPPQDDELWLLYEEEMSRCADLIFEMRKNFTQKFLPVFQHFYNLISGNGERVDLRYTSQIYRGSLVEQLREVRNRDLLLGYTTRGTHRDDFEFFMGDYLIRKVGSQGQTKSFLIALKLAQFSFLHSLGGIKPILLLDDVFDKLDATRVEQIINIVASDEFGQIFLTDTNRNHLEEIIQRQPQNFRLFNVANGTVTPSN